MSQAEGQQKNLVQSIESLPTRGPLSCLDQDLLLLKATSAATLSCLGECLSILQQSSGHGHHHHHNQHHQQGSSTTTTPRPGPPACDPPSGESALGPPLLLPLGPPDPGKGQVEVDCGLCPSLSGPLQLNVCNKCC